MSKLTSKYQTTIPQEIRQFLGLGKGDMVRFDIENDKVVLNKEIPLDLSEPTETEYMQLMAQTMTEWQSDEDDDLLPPWQPHKTA
ncbi:MAG: type II toxin-antitoxin system PrlF family antitoxin [Pseudomonadota bacterium]|nr:type II toxin-antitoxin system PrlF family antitoxin [Pseudomonadota bacterium]MDE3038809.1 type II toxin-antitoxin system PrlF family antitoxin [Pseudomonadota bacterium]